MKKKNISIQSKIFRLYSIIILVIVLIVVLISYTYIANTLRESAFESLENLTSSLSKNIDLEIKKMDDLTTNVMYSYLIRDSFQQYVDIQSSNTKVDDEATYSSEDERSTVKQMVDILVAIQGPSLSIPQIMLHTYTGKSISTRSNNYYNTDLQEKYWFDEVNQKDGLMYITLPYTGNDMSMSTDQFTSDWLISVCRTYFDKANSPQGIVETKQYCFVLFSEISKTEKSDMYSSAYVIDKDGNVVYPYILSDEKQNEANQISKQIAQKNSLHNVIIVDDENNQEKSIISYHISSYTGWTVVLTSSERKVLSPLYVIIRNLLMASLIILIISIFISYVFAGQLSKPINKLSKTLHDFDINGEQPKIDLESNIDEIVELNQAFSSMSAQLKTSVDTLLAVQQQEMHSKMLALQSQMNPHFLYNTLSIISVMAEEGMDDEIVEMSENLSDILRYISTDSSHLVTLKQEIDIAKKYLDCMTFRYTENLIYIIDIPRDMCNVLVPKLSIQPLVENSIKYMGHVAPPWRIIINGSVQDNKYKITVSDNGGGFSDEILAKLNTKIKSIHANSLIPSLKLDGMGILNLYMRIKLSNKSDFLFELGNNETGGAYVSFGAHIEEIINE